MSQIDKALILPFLLWIIILGCFFYYFIFCLLIPMVYAALAAREKKYLESASEMGDILRELGGTSCEDSPPDIMEPETSFSLRSARRRAKKFWGYLRFSVFTFETLMWSSWLILFLATGLSIAISYYLYPIFHQTLGQSQGGELWDIILLLREQFRDMIYGGEVEAKDTLVASVFIIYTFMGALTYMLYGKKLIGDWLGDSVAQHPPLFEAGTWPYNLRLLNVYPDEVAFFPPADTEMYKGLIKIFDATLESPIGNTLNHDFTRAFVLESPDYWRALNFAKVRHINQAIIHHLDPLALDYSMKGVWKVLQEEYGEIGAWRVIHYALHPYQTNGDWAKALKADISKILFTNPRSVPNILLSKDPIEREVFLDVVIKCLPAYIDTEILGPSLRTLGAQRRMWDLKGFYGDRGLYERQIVDNVVPYPYRTNPDGDWDGKHYHIWNGIRVSKPSYWMLYELHQQGKGVVEIYLDAAGNRVIETDVGVEWMNPAFENSEEELEFVPEDYDDSEDLPGYPQLETPQEPRGRTMYRPAPGERTRREDSSVARNRIFNTPPDPDLLKPITMEDAVRRIEEDAALAKQELWSRIRGEKEGLSAMEMQYWQAIRDSMRHRRMPTQTNFTENIEGVIEWSKMTIQYLLDEAYLQGMKEFPNELERKIMAASFQRKFVSSIQEAAAAAEKEALAPAPVVAPSPAVPSTTSTGEALEVKTKGARLFLRDIQGRLEDVLNVSRNLPAEERTEALNVASQKLYERIDEAVAQFAARGDSPRDARREELWQTITELTVEIKTAESDDLRQLLETRREILLQEDTALEEASEEERKAFEQKAAAVEPVSVDPSVQVWEKEKEFWNSVVKAVEKAVNIITYVHPLGDPARPQVNLPPEVIAAEHSNVPNLSDADWAPQNPARAGQAPGDVNVRPLSNPARAGQAPGDVNVRPLSNPERAGQAPGDVNVRPLSNPERAGQAPGGGPESPRLIPDPQIAQRPSLAKMEGHMWEQWYRMVREDPTVVELEHELWARLKAGIYYDGPTPGKDYAETLEGIRRWYCHQIQMTFIQSVKERADAGETKALEKEHQDQFEGRLMGQVRKVVWKILTQEALDVGQEPVGDPHRERGSSEERGTPIERQREIKLWQLLAQASERAVNFDKEQERSPSPPPLEIDPMDPEAHQASIEVQLWQALSDSMHYEGPGPQVSKEVYYKTVRGIDFWNQVQIQQILMKASEETDRQKLDPNLREQERISFQENLLETIPSAARKLIHKWITLRHDEIMAPQVQKDFDTEFSDEELKAAGDFWSFLTEAVKEATRGLEGRSEAFPPEPQAPVESLVFPEQRGRLRERRARLKEKSEAEAPGARSGSPSPEREEFRMFIEALAEEQSPSREKEQSPSREKERSPSREKERSPSREKEQSPSREKEQGPSTTDAEVLSSSPSGEADDAKAIVDAFLSAMYNPEGAEGAPLELSPGTPHIEEAYKQLESEQNLPERRSWVKSYEEQEYDIEADAAMFAERALMRHNDRERDKDILVRKRAKVKLEAELRQIREREAAGNDTQSESERLETLVLYASEDVDSDQPAMTEEQREAQRREDWALYGSEDVDSDQAAYLRGGEERRQVLEGSEKDSRSEELFEPQGLTSEELAQYRATRDIERFHREKEAMDEERRIEREQRMELAEKMREKVRILADSDEESVGEIYQRDEVDRYIELSNTEGLSSQEDQELLLLKQLLFEADYSTDSSIQSWSEGEKQFIADLPPHKFNKEQRMEIDKLINGMLIDPVLLTHPGYTILVDKAESYCRRRNIFFDRRLKHHEQIYLQTVHPEYREKGLGDFSAHMLNVRRNTRNWNDPKLYNLHPRWDPDASLPHHLYQVPADLTNYKQQHFPVKKPPRNYMELEEEIIPPIYAGGPSSSEGPGSGALPEASEEVAWTFWIQYFLVENTAILVELFQFLVLRYPSLAVVAQVAYILFIIFSVLNRLYHIFFGPWFIGGFLDCLLERYRRWWSAFELRYLMMAGVGGYGFSRYPQRLSFRGLVWMHKRRIRLFLARHSRQRSWYAPIVGWVADKYEWVHRKLAENKY